MIKHILLGLLSVGICVNANAGRAEADMMQKLRVMYPNTQFDQVIESEVKDLFEIKMGRNVAYTNKEGRYFLFGHLYDMASQQDLTASRHRQGNEKTVKMYWPVDSLDNAIKTVRGDGSRKMAVFSDPDCGYCKRLEANLTKISDVTIYTFLYPLDQIHPEAKSKSISIWCAADQSQAWSDFMLGNKPAKLETCKHPINENIMLAQKFGVQGTPTMINEQGVALVGAASSAEIEAWLTQSESEGAAQ